MGPAGRHLDVRAALDYLESRADAESRRRVEEHLGTPCGVCRDLVRELGWLVERMRLDRVPEATPAMSARAIALFDPSIAATGSRQGATRMARLLFDSWTRPLPAGAVRAVGEMRRLRFALGADMLELESEIESAEARTLRGRLRATDPSIHRIEVAIGRERFTARPDAHGSFAFDRIPLAPAVLTVSEAGNRYRIPPLE